MNIRFRTVRAKLTALVALSVVVMFATIPVLSWLLHRQLIDEIDDRVVEAEKSFQSELDDDVADLTLTVHIMAVDSDTTRALSAHDAKAALDLATQFSAVYPELDVILGDAQGNVLAELGVTAPPERIDSIRELAGMNAGADFQGVIEHGCEKPGSNGAPAIVIARGIKDVGSIIVCQPLDQKYLVNAGGKLGLELALLDPSRARVGMTPLFPTATPTALGESSLFRENGKAWTIAAFEPKGLAGQKGKYAIAAALDVSDIERIVREHLYYALGIILFAAVISVAFGARLASIMSRALKRVNDALKKLEQQEYAHVIGVKTGDELEDLANGFNSMVDGLKERDKLRTTFGKYVTSAVVDHLMSGKVELGGASIPVTILFTDIRSFTTISEKMDAQALVGLLNEYFTDMVGIVMEEDGVVDKYIGDAIMAVFGAPVPKKDDPIHAVRAAVRMRQALVHLNERLKERGIAPLRTGIGIHTGVVVAGNIGSEKRMEYTVIGDPVNLASRLESSTKDLGVAILISDDTYELVKDSIDARQVKEITVKGRLKPVMTYEVLGIKGEAPLVPSERVPAKRSEASPS